ncbi:MAG TPA: LamG-like jellyroll fold domain-containing protein [Candidatus Polarisedimenticolia bacterium]|nr:LamG-like jellyroll fold domain-containing protein [Candidatus Polarisedimenticolia bacterium]
MSSSTLTFQQGVDGYAGTVDTLIAFDTPDADNSAATTITVDGSPLRHVLIRFDGIIGNGAGQVPPGATILSATLTVNVSNVSANAAAFHRMIQSWSATSTWNSLVGGVQANGIEAVATADVSGASSATGPFSIGVTASLAAWSAGGSNLGWALLPGGTDGWGFDSSEAATVANRPRLAVTFTTDRSPNPPSNESPATGSTGVSASPTLCVDASDPDGGQLTVTFKGRPTGQPAPQDFTLIALPDTQYYAQSYPATFSAQTQWIVDNLLSRNIAFVTQLGDCTNDGNNIPSQWTTANSAFSLLEDSFTTGLAHGIPYGIAVGNHDQTPFATARSGADEGTAFGGAGGTFGGTTQYYNRTFGAFRFQGRGYFGGHYDFGVPAQYSDSMDNHFELFSASGMNFIAFHLEWDDVDNPTRQAVLNWVHTLLSTTYSNRRAIITSHYLLNTNGTFSNQGQATFNAIKDLPNVFLMLAGHLDQANRRTDLADDGHPIHSLLSDYQSRPNGGNGWLRIMTFSPASDTFHVQTYSPTLGQFINNHADNTAGTAQNDFVLGYDMDSGTPFATIGTASGVASGGRACAAWPGRETGQEYEWFAEVSDGELTTTGPLWTFTASCSTNAECDDAIFCTTDTCNGGSCLHSPIADCCGTNAECDDADPCTNDACNLSGHSCENTPIDCNDGRSCTGPDACVGGVCQNPYTPFAGCCASPADCDDGIATTTDTCSAGTCSNVNTACLANPDCSDGDACTTDSCTAANLRSLVLDGVDDHVTMGAAAGLNASPAFSIEAWINGTSGTGISTGTQGLASAIPLVAKGAPQAETPANVNMNYFLGLDVEGSNRRLAADFEDAATGLNHAVCSTGNVPATGWHHVAATYSPANGWRLYLDGVAQTLTTDNTTCTTCVAPNCTTTPGATPEPNSIQHFGIGTSLTSTGGVNGRYQGKIDEVRVWNVERSAPEIADARDELIATAANLIAHYGFDDSTATDSTSPAENGTLVGSPVFDSSDRPAVGGACLYLPLSCDDGNPCTADSCTGGSCLHIPANDGGACNDGDGCTNDDICTNGVCAGTLSCDDGNACTGTDQCVSGSCQNPYNPTPGCCTTAADCDDGNPATADSCSAGTCSNVNLVCATGADCNDSDGCTADECVSANVAALSFDGTDDYVTMGPSAGTGSLGAATFTVETWFKWTGAGVTTSTGTGGIAALIPLVAKGAAQAETPANVNANYILGIAGGRLAGDFEDAATGLNHPVCTAAAQPTISTNVWHHAAASYNGTCWQLYLDGVAVPIDTACSTCAGGACTVCPGATPESTSIQHFGLGTTLTSTGTAAGFYQGRLDEVRVWNVARSLAQIQADRFQEVSSAPNLIGRWGLNENAGTTAGDSTTPAENGTLTSGPAWSPTDRAPLTSGTCSYTPIPGCTPCSTAADCNDGNPCTTDSCSPSSACVHTNNNAPCSEDGNPCTDDVCSGGSCTHPNDNSNACADANACTGDACVGGACLSWYSPTPACCDSNADCNDGVAATSDACTGAPDGNCTNVIPGSCTTNASCNDFNGCTTDACTTPNLSALSFDGTNDYVTMGAAAGTSALGATTFTVETWFKWTGAGVTTSTGTGGIAALIPLVAKGAAQAETPPNLNANYILGIAGGRLAGDFEDSATGLNHPVCTAAAQPTISTNVWHHAAAAYNGTCWTLFLDGAALPIDTSCSTCAGGACTVCPGATPESTSIQHFGLGTTLTSTGAATGFYQGLLDEVRVWNVARSLAEIQAGKDQEITSGTGLIGRWGLNENGGTAAADSTTPAQNGTLTNFNVATAWSATDKSPVAPGTCSNTPIPNCASCTADYQCSDSNSCTADSCNTTNDAAVSFPSPGAAANRVDLALGGGSDSSPDYVNYFGTGSFTIEGWVYTDGGAASLTGIFRGGQQGAFPQVAVQLTGTGNLQIAGSVESNTTGTQVDVTHGTALTVNTWAHFAFVVDRTPGNQQLRLHLNGGAPATAVANLLGTNPVSFTSQSMIGAARLDTGAVGLPFDGRLDEIRIWNYARTQAETAAEMGREIGSAAGLVHRWSFNEGSLTNASDSAGGSAGTLTGATTWSTTGLPFAGSDICTHTSLANGAACSDGNACTQTDTCQAGVCNGSNTVTCTASDACHDAGTCDPGTGLCSNPAKPNGAACSDGNACTQTDTCQAGVCTGSSTVTCTASDQCHDAGTCNPGTGLCSNPAKPNGAACSDGNACTPTDTCQAGVCTGSNTVICTASDQCHDAGTCDPGTGLCSNPAKPNGAACSDGDACTQTDTCQSGVCTGSNTVTCTASDQCHNAGTCNPATGVCSNPAKPNGAACSDGNACTQTDTCQAGVCTGSNTVTCTASDQCHNAGTCDPGTGLCSNPAKPNGAACSDGNACTTTDACQNGACAPGPAADCNDNNVCTDDSCDPPVGCRHSNNTASCDDGDVCNGTGVCHDGACAGTPPPNCDDGNPCSTDSCDPVLGCRHVNNTASCDDGNACTRTDTCQSGVCTGSNPVTCTASDQCHDAGTCNPATGVCSNPARPNGAACNDGSACTQTDTCQAGVCSGANPVVCTASDQCHDAGTCNPATGVCSNPAKANGSLCSDGNACTLSDTCQSGLCAAGSAVVCVASDQCHVPGVCSPASGLCSNPSKPDGSACDDGNTCTAGDSCIAGTCTSGAAPPEVCNGLDDNCNTLIDEGNPGGGVACSTGQPGVCSAGITQCTGGSIVCVGTTSPATPNIVAQINTSMRYLANNATTAAEDTVLVQIDSPMRYKANSADPGIGLAWINETYDDTGWNSGTYGVGYDTEAPPNALSLIKTGVPAGTFSVFTRATFSLADVSTVKSLFYGADYDDGYVAYLNGVEVARSSTMPAGSPAWNTNAALHESSNAALPNYGTLIDLTGSISLLHNGTNVLAVGVWNSGAATSTDLVVVPKLSIGLDWTARSFNDSTWSTGTYGVGYDTAPAPNALNLIKTSVPAGTLSVFTRAHFNIPDAAALAAIQSVTLGVDYDDGTVAWINGVEVLGSAEMPFGPLNPTTPAADHESSNGAAPNYSPIRDVTARALPALVVGDNVLAIGVWNNLSTSTDLVLVPRLSLGEAERCDGLDNDCNGIVDDGFPDNDHDGQADCADTDDDGDGTADGQDCKPLDPLSSAAPPAEILDLLFVRAPDRSYVMTWTGQGGGLHYDVAGGLLSRLRPDGGALNATCVPGGNDLVNASFIDTRPAPPRGESYYYIVRSQSSFCGSGTYGHASSGAEILPASACP